MKQSAEQLLTEIRDRLEELAILQAYGIVAGQTVAEGAPLLRRLGLSLADIARVFDSTANAVSVRLAEASKKGVKSARRKRTL